MKIFKSLDFKSQLERIEPNVSGENLVHLEDYENINDLIRRSIRTKSRFVPETDKNAFYDEDFLIDKEMEIQEMINRTEYAGNEAVENTEQAKQSDGSSEVPPTANDGNIPLP